jgi:hypothetical protein
MKITRCFVKVLFPAFIITTACDKDDITIPESKPDGEALHHWFDSGVMDREQHFTLTVSTGGALTGSQGTKLDFGPNAFTTLSGEAVTGSVDITLVELYDRASMLLTKKPTNGKRTDGSISTMVSGGEFFVNATQNGSPLKLKSGYTIVAPTENTGEIDQEMKQFDGEINCEGDDCDLVWNEVQDRGIEIGEFQVTGGFKTAYYVFQSKFGWTNIDRWYNDPRPKTKIFVDVPEGFDNTNCVVYIAYDGEPTALGSFDIYDKDKKLFTEHYGLIPVGLKVHFILVSIIDDTIHYAIQGATITENHTEIIENVQSITEDKLIDLIAELP